MYGLIGSEGAGWPLNGSRHRRRKFLEPFSFRLNRNGGSICLFDAFSSREPVSTSLENALSSEQSLHQPAIQSSGCAPVAKAYKEGANASQMFENAATFAAGLRVPKPYGDYIILDIVRQSGGTIVDLPDEKILDSLLDWSRHEGLLLSPEGAAATAAYDHLIETGFLKPSDKVVIFNTGAGLKYVDMIAEAMKIACPSTTDLPKRTPVGGIITPQ